MSTRSPLQTTPDVTVRIQRLAHAGDRALPSYGTAGRAGLVVRAAIDGPLDLQPGTITRVPTGFAIEVPEGFEMQVRPRSGLAMKHGVTLPNSPATIDSDYRGEVIVALIHHGTEPFRIERGMRIAQMVLARVPRVSWSEVEDLSDTARGAGGFGHTGVT
jgi:dUTP pyrophosphatase